ncbi:MAG: hypothetical protein A3K19_25170 [Lentisphaerae bacterium RIFOXYB12_FULL_65_16]|nr:MAG: hypothetical protein A3K18_07285 [Lentisphaerae bacterium RIFOXYA12_64_32]OGV91113.1 MAG: hypothetical protein A3K19_25170 [Lentisphaerae bacterium RIFOXYB12_FULL_65_16]
MATLSACVEMFWNKEPVDARIRHAADVGFKYVEFWGWKNKDLDAIAKATKETGVRLATFCMEADKRLVEPDAAQALKDGLTQSIAAARKLNVDRLILTTGNERKAETYEITRRTVVRNLKAIAPILEKEKMTLVLEPLNPIVNHLGYWLTKMSEAADICYEVDSPYVKILMDIYHQQVTEGNVIANLRQYTSLIGHYHTAGVPGRHELAGGELDYRSIFKAIDETGYKHCVGLEFSPTMDVAAALKQALDLAK